MADRKSLSLIYKITNTVTGLVYIGQTTRGLKRRRYEHIAAMKRGDNKRLYNAMREYGLDKFDFSVLVYVPDPIHLNELEKHFIAEYDTFTLGYNMTDGGDGLAPEACAKISNALKGRDAHWISKTIATRKANGGWRSTKGLVPSGAANSKAKAYLIREPSGKEVKIVGLKAYCREHGLTFKAMYDTLNGLQKQHRGYVLLGYADSMVIS